MESAWPAHHGEMGRRIRAFDWEATPLGASDNWPRWLRLAIDLILVTRLPSAIHVRPNASTERALPFQLGDRSSFALREDCLVCANEFPLTL